MGEMDVTEWMDWMDWMNEQILLNEWIEGQNNWTKWNVWIDLLLGNAWSIAL